MSTTERKNDLQNKVDSPLINPEDDCLDRKRIAERIFALINETPFNTHLRIGVLGPWGSGKTTILNFIKHQCEKENPVAFFCPWQFNSREEARKGFVSSLESSLDLWKKPPFWKSFKIKRVSKSIVKILLAIVGLKYGFAKVIDNLIFISPKSQLKKRKQNVNKELKEILGDKKRFYIFIDDLDRSEPTIVYDMLMLLNEIVDLDRCIYIIGLDVKTISEVLRERLGHINSRDFIDKIINYRFELPIPASRDWKILLEKEYERVGSSDIKKDIILKILPILSENPRKFKHYLSDLSNLHQTFLYRLDDDDRDWELLYLCQLLNLEFPDIFRGLRQDNEIINDLAFGNPINSALNQENKNISAETNWIDKIKEELKKYGDIDTPRFFEIYQAIRRKMIPYHRAAYSGISSEHIKKHLFVIEELEIITSKEYREYKEGLLLLDDTELKCRLEELIANSTDSKNTEWIREFMKMLLQEKDQIFEHLIRLPPKDKMQAQLSKCEEIIRICDLLADVDELYRVEKPIFDEATFREWYGSLLRQGRFVESDNFYEELHIKQKALLLKVVKKNLIRVSEICEWLCEQLEITSEDEVAQEIKEEVRTVLYEELVKDLLNRFRKNNGIKEVYLDPTKFRTEQDFLSESDSPFYSEESYNKLKAIAAEAEKDIIVYGNFVDLLLFIWRPVIERKMGPERQNILTKIMQQKKFLEIIWQAVVCRPLNVRWVGTLEKAIQSLLNAKIIDEDYFKRPEWWSPILDKNKGEE